MAELIATSNGNFDGSIWVTSCGGTGATQLSTSGTGGTTTSYVYCPTFTCNTGDSILGVILFISSNSQHNQNTLSVALSDDNGVTATREVTIGVLDIAASSNTWVYFKFGSALTADGGSDYRIGVKGSTTTNMRVHRSATISDWTRIVVTNNSGTPAAGDMVFIGAGKTANATGDPQVVVTMNQTAVTSYGNVVIFSGGSLRFGTTGSTNYVFEANGFINVYSNAQLWVGNSSDPIPRTSTATLQINSASNSSSGLYLFDCNFQMQGQSRTSGKNVSVCNVTANVANTDTVVSVDTDTGWLSGDMVVIPGTNGTFSNCAYLTVSSSNSTTVTFTTSSTSLYPHITGNVHTIPLVNMTRNVKFSPANVTNTTRTFLQVHGTNTFSNIAWTEFNYVGGSQDVTLGIFRVNTTSWNKFAFDHVVVKNSGSGVSVTGVVTPANFSVNNFCFVNSFLCFQSLALSSTFQKIENIVIIDNRSGISMFVYAGNVEISNCRFFSGNNASGVDALEIFNGGSMTTYYGRVTANNIQAVNVRGIRMSGNPYTAASFNNLHIIRSSMPFVTNHGQYEVNNSVFIGKGATTVFNVNGHFDGYFSNCTFTASPIAGDTESNYGMGVSMGATGKIELKNSTFGNSSYGGGTLTTADIRMERNGTAPCEIFASNVSFASTTEANVGYTILENTLIESSLNSENHDQVLGNHKTFKLFGRIENDTTIYRTASPSERLTPNNASNKIVSHPRTAPVNSGGTVTISVNVRKSQAGDGAAYNGGEPRLIVLANPGAGITTNTVLDTMTYSNSSWETLTGTTSTVSFDTALQFVVDCAGTAGWINLDDWSIG